MAKMNHILLYGNYEEAFQYLTHEQVGRLIRNLLHYLNTEEEIPPKGAEKCIWGLMLDQVKRNMRKYEKTCERNRQNAQKYWDSHREGGDECGGIEPV